MFDCWQILPPVSYVLLTATKYISCLSVIRKLVSQLHGVQLELVVVGDLAARHCRSVSYVVRCNFRGFMCSDLTAVNLYCKSESKYLARPSEVIATLYGQPGQIKPFNGNYIFW